MIEPTLVLQEAFEEAHRVLQQANGAAPEADVEFFRTRKRRDRRPSVKFKGPEFGLEFRALIHKAAELQGMTQAAFVSSVLMKEAERIIRGDDSTSQLSPALSVPGDQGGQHAREHRPLTLEQRRSGQQAHP
jgi:hypothetical protein